MENATATSPREDLLESIEKGEEDVRAALNELAGAAGLGLDVTGRVAEHARALVRERPVAAMLAAAGIGFLVARLVLRSESK